MNVILRVTSTTKVDVGHGIVQQKETPLSRKLETKTNKQTKDNNMRHTEDNKRFAIGFILCSMACDIERITIITLFRSKTMFSKTDSILQNIHRIQNVRNIL